VGGGLPALRPRIDAQVEQHTGLFDAAALEPAAMAAIADAERAGYALSVAVIELARGPNKDSRDRSIILALQATVRATDQLFRLDDFRVAALLPMAAGRVVVGILERSARLCEGPLTWSMATTGADGRSLAAMLAATGRRTFFTS
jgi:hypothetical protein